LKIWLAATFRPATVATQGGERRIVGVYKDHKIRACKAVLRIIWQLREYMPFFLEISLSRIAIRSYRRKSVQK
jgi:hypothetical protein